MRPAEWYDFVPLPKEKKGAPDASALTHAKHLAGRYSGFLDLEITTLSPVHIGSGAYELSEDADLERGTVVKGMVRLNGSPVIPSSSLKGALRSVYEMITFSCVGRPRKSSYERYPFITSPKMDIRLRGEELKALIQCRLHRGQDDLSILCPACALFGVENFQGRLSFSDAEVCKSPKESKRSIQIPSLYGPRLHRLGDPIEISRGRRPFIEVRNLKGRKAYYKIQLGDVPADGQVLIDYLPSDSKLSTKLYFLNATLAELGGLLTALGLDPESCFPLRIGGGKPVGLGYIAFELKDIHIQKGDTAFLEFDTQFTEEAATNKYLQTFRESEGKLFYRQGLEKLCEIIARPYVPALEEVT